MLGMEETNRNRKQLDRVRSCGSIGDSNSENKLWVTNTKAPMPRSDCEDDYEEALENRSSLSRSLQTNAATKNSLPLLPATTTMRKAHSKEGRNIVGFNKFTTTVPKRAVAAPGLQPSRQRRGRRSQKYLIVSGEVALSENERSSPMLFAKALSKSRKEINIRNSREYRSNEDRLVAI
ncbi:hypothetical protein FQA39_LY11199 [Lamprigera yunnana]|nr:hypothetical protein FQA39_LY11199 [Lamprigera yunnana]